MKRIVALLSALLIFVAALTSCSNEDNVYAEFETNPEAEVVLIGPSGNKSFLAYYNADLTELLSVVKIDFPRLSFGSVPSVYTDGKAFVISGHDYTNKYTDTSDEVIVLDFKTGKVDNQPLSSKVSSDMNAAENVVTPNDAKMGKGEKLPLTSTAIFDMCAEGNTVYTVKHDRLESYNVETGEKSEFMHEEFCADDIYVCGDTAYFAADISAKDEEHTTLYLLDAKTLDVKKTYVLDYELHVSDMIEIDRKLYISSVGERNLLCLDLETERFEILETGSQYACGEMLQYKDELIIANTDTVTIEGDELTRYNPTTKEIKTEKLDAQTWHMQIKGDYLYQESQDKIAVYDLSKPQLTKINEIEKTVDDKPVYDFFVF